MSSGLATLGRPSADREVRHDADLGLAAGSSPPPPSFHSTGSEDHRGEASDPNRQTL